MAYRFDDIETVPEAVSRTAEEQLQSAQSELSDGIERDPVEAVHTARKAVKKERALLRLVRDAVGASARRRENTALRDAGRKLSDTRDAEVLVQALDDLHERYAGQIPMRSFAAFRAHLEGERAAARARLHDPDLAPVVVDELDGVRERLGQLRLKSGGWDAIAGGLKRSYKRGRKAFRRARAEPDVERLHEWRKRAKDIWYHLRLVAGVCGPGVRGEAKDAHALADLLGDDHDLAVLRNALVAHGGEVSADTDALLALIDHRREQLQAEAMLIGERVYAESPKAFMRRIRRYWHAGRARARAVRDTDPAELAEATRAAPVG